MATNVKPITEGMEGVIPYLSCKNAAEMLDFYRRAFGAVELRRMPGPGGKVMHAEIKIGRVLIMLADEFAEMNFVSPATRGGPSVTLYIYVEDVDALARQATAAGATLEGEVRNEFYGDRVARLRDPSGHSWNFATHVEDVSDEELARRAAAMFGGGK